MVTVKLRSVEVEELRILIRGGESELGAVVEDGDHRRREYERSRLVSGSLLEDALRTAQIEDELGLQLKYRIGDFLYWVDQPGTRAIVLDIKADPYLPNSARYTVESDLEEELNASVHAHEDDLTRNYDGSPDDE